MPLGMRRHGAILKQNMTVPRKQGGTENIENRPKRRDGYGNELERDHFRPCHGFY